MTGEAPAPSTRAGWPSRRLGATMGAGACLVALVAYLLLANHQSAGRIRQQLLVQHQQAFQLHAVALSHFLGSAGEDLRYLAESSEVAAFHESRDLGMSMQYGLGLSLIPIRARLQALVSGAGAAGSRFSGAMVLDADGTVLAQAGERGAPPSAGTISGGAGAARLDLDRTGTRLVVSHLHWFKGRYAGRVVGRLRPEAVAAALAGDRLVSEDISRLEVLDPDGRIYRPAPEPWPAPPRLADVTPDGRFQERPGAGQHGADLMVARLPVPGQPITLVDIDRSADLLGEAPAWGGGALTLAAVLVLAVVAAAVFLDSKSLALRTRLDESHRREAEVAEKHEALARVERERRRLWQAVNQSPAMVIITDRTGRIEYVNPTFELVTGFGALDTLGKGPRFLAADEASGARFAEAFATLEAGGTWHGELRNRKRSGEYFWMSVSVSPARDENGEITHFIALGEDVSARRRAAEELERARDAAEAANKAKSAFLANMSHEIRTPLNAILGYSQLVTRDPDLAPGSRRNLEIINSSGEHLLALLNDVLEISKIEAGRSTLDPSAFDLRAMLKDVESMFALRAGGKGLRFKVAVGAEVPRRLVADEGKVRQVLVNLLGNAVKFTDKGSVMLTVAAHVEEDHLRLSMEVADTGVGIGPEEVGRLFREFEQAAAGRRAGSGTGLGLVISRSYARLMGGDLTVASELGMGSRFTFEFPAHATHEAAGPRDVAPRVVGLRGGAAAPRIFLADDQESNRDWLRQALVAVGFEIREGVDGRGAVEACAAGWPDLVLLDIRMPVMDGIEAARRIRALPGARRVPLLALTASGVGAEREAMLRAGADEIISKPVREQELLEVLRVRLGLDYLYAGPAAAPAPCRPTAAAVQAVSVAGLPAALRDALREATQRGDLDRLDELIGQAAGRDAAAAEALRALASRYDFEALSRALA